MSIEEARERARQLNAIEKREEEKKARIVHQERMKAEELIECIHLPELLVKRFERKIFDDFYGTKEEFKKSKTMSHWRATKRAIRDLDIEPQYWSEDKRSFYKYFIKNDYSYSYVE